MDQIVAQGERRHREPGRNWQRRRKRLSQELKAQGRHAGTARQQEVQKRRRDMLRDRIDELLLMQKAKELNINVDSEVTKYMTEPAAAGWDRGSGKVSRIRSARNPA